MTLRRLVNMAEGRADAELDMFIEHQNDAWERTSRIISMIHNTTRSTENDCKPPDDFNDLKRWLKEGTPGAKEEYDDLAWMKKG